jgi:DNA-binding response OmpR family regulator
MPDAARILIVDDETGIRDMVAEYLSGFGYDVATAADAAMARAEVAAAAPDLAILDIRMPGEDGLSLLRHLRAHHRMAIVMLTSVDDLVDRIVGLEVGADDYLTKPFDPRELLARIKAILRRQHQGDDDRPAVAPGVPFGHCRLDLEQAALFDEQGAEIPLSAAEFRLLCAFHERPNHVFSRDELLERVQGRDWDGHDRSIDIRIARLRQKIERVPDKPTVIKTVRGAGYLYAKPRA